MPIDRATVLIDGAPVTILPRRAPVGNSGPIRGRSLAIFSAAADAASTALPGDVTDRYAATIEPGGQPGIAIPDLAEADARAAGHALGLDEILFWDGRRAQILSCH